MKNKKQIEQEILNHLPTANLLRTASYFLDEKDYPIWADQLQEFSLLVNLYHKILRVEKTHRCEECNTLLNIGYDEFSNLKSYWCNNCGWTFNF